MESLYGITNSKVHKRSCLSPINNFALPNPYYRHAGPVMDQYLSPEPHTTALKNLNSPLIRYLQSARSLSVSPSGSAEHPYSVGYKYRLSNIENSPRMESPRQSRSPLVYSNSPVKVEEDVLVMDGVLLKNPPAEKSSGGSSSAGSSKFYKMDLCLSYLEGFCRYGTKCQFAHGNKELHPSQLSYKTMFETPCKSYNLSGTCLFGSKCRFPHYRTSITMATSTTQPVSPIKLDEPAASSSTVNLNSTNWYPLDDDIEIQTAIFNNGSDEHFDACVNKVLYSPSRTKRLPVFTQIFPE